MSAETSIQWLQWDGIRTGRGAGSGGCQWPGGASWESRCGSGQVPHLTRHWSRQGKPKTLGLEVTP
jgi:hypothetical protein